MRNVIGLDKGQWLVEKKYKKGKLFFHYKIIWRMRRNDWIRSDEMKRRGISFVNADALKT